jgi:DNA-directed RNA polymerase specialized sigma24 family protein
VGKHTVAVFDADLPLVNASRNGDASAFEELVKKYDAKLYRVAQGMIHNHEDAEEVVQTAVRYSYRASPKLDQNGTKTSTFSLQAFFNLAMSATKPPGPARISNSTQEGIGTT